MDSLTYKYNGTNNQLQYVNDNVSSGAFSVDVDDQSSGNYAYTEIGELKQDNANGISDIEWRVDGKIKKIERSGNQSQVEFAYDAFGRRVLKLVKPTTGGVPNASSTWTYTYYVNDVQGNIVATYSKTTSGSVETYKLKEEYIYGADMLGNVDADVTLATYNTSSTVLTESVPDVSKRVLGEKEFERRVKDLIINSGEYDNFWFHAEAEPYTDQISQPDIRADVQMVNFDKKGRFVGVYRYKRFNYIEIKATKNDIGLSAFGG